VREPEVREPEVREPEVREPDVRRLVGCCWCWWAALLLLPSAKSCINHNTVSSDSASMIRILTLIICTDPDPNQTPDPGPDLSINKQKKSEKTWISTVCVTSHCCNL
jgi:hypothetical protein